MPDYVLVREPEPSHVGAAQRWVVRIRVHYGLTREALESLLRSVAGVWFEELRADALAVFAYGRESDPDGPFTVGMAEIAPGGDWSRATSGDPLAVRVESLSDYFKRDLAAEQGQTRYVTSELPRFKTVLLSQRFESWGHEDIVARVPNGTPVEVLETREVGTKLQHRVRAAVDGRVVEGWMHADNLW